MKKILAGFAIALITFSAMAGNHDSDNADLHAAIKAFDDAYSTNDVAIATSFIDNRTRNTDGSKTTAKAFQTDVWQKFDGKWKIISLHYSEFTAEEGRAR